MASVPPSLVLPDASKIAGLEARMFLNECRSPAYADYDGTATLVSMRRMSIVLHNRAKLTNYKLFGASGANI
jgi:hypothetical protein